MNQATLGWTQMSRNWCNISAGLFCLLCVAPISYMLLDRTPPMAYENGFIVPPVAAPGELVTVTWRTHVERSCTGTVHRKLIDSQGVVWDFEPTETASFESRTHVQLSRDFKVPYAVAYGVTKYRVVIRWVCNPLHNWWPVVVQTPVLFFTIAPREKVIH